MKNSSRTSLAIGILAICCFSSQYSLALDTLALLESGPSKMLLESKKPIYAETQGSVPIRFSRALDVLQQPELMTNVQRAYCELIAEGGTPEFTINQTSTNTYYYINKDGERTDITEVLKRKTSDTTFDMVLYSAGQRFFGNYQALIHVQIVDVGNGSVSYVSSVYAYPENAVSRFFARHLGLVNRYFKSKTSQMTDIITAISCRLCGQVEGDA